MKIDKKGYIMTQDKPKLEALLKDSKGSKILFLGKEGVFTRKEVQRFLKGFGLTMVENIEEGVVACIEHSRLNPVEEAISDDAYAAKIPLFSLDEFEQILSKEIKDDELLMGIKLINDQARIFRLLGNPNISNELFVKLLTMYEWHDEEEDNRDDRDVITYVLRRYIKIKPNEEDLLYSYLTLRRLATEATDPKMLIALIGFPNFTFLVRGKESITLRETIARNENVDKEVLTKLITLRDEKVDAALASNLCVPLSVLKKFASKNKEKINQALASNKNIDNEIFELLLTKSEEVISLLLLWQPIGLKRLKAVENHNITSELFAIIGANEGLSEEVVFDLIQRDDLSLLLNLSRNDTLPTEALDILYKRQISELYYKLAANKRLAVEKFETLYEGADDEMSVALASNPSTPEKILRELYERDDLDINKGLASNTSTPLELLDVLKIDTRLQNSLTKNQVFIDHHNNTKNII